MTAAPYRKKLIEVALPLKAINEASAREKSIRHGHPSTLHLWWARRPLAACRAVLFASLVDDPDSDPAYRKADGTVDEDRAGLKRAQLFNLIEELVQWENSNNPRVINAARAEIARCVASRKIELGELKKDTVISGERKGQSHPRGPVSGDGITAWEIVLMQARPEVVNDFLAEHAPPVMDPFAGGGSIPLEAQRLGLRAYASDLNPVAVLINKALIEIPPKFAGQPPVNPDWQGKSDQEKALARWEGARGLAEDVRCYGQWIRHEAEKRIGHFYPKARITAEMAKDRPDLEEYVGRELTVIAWLWARTVTCPNPACRSRMPLVRSFALSTKKGKEVCIEPVADPLLNGVFFSISVGRGRPPDGTVGRRGAKCPCCGINVPLDHIRAEGKENRLGSQMMAMVVKGRTGNLYLAPARDHEDLANQTHLDWVPESELPKQALGFRVQAYGITRHADLFSPRQAKMLSAVSDLIKEARERISCDAHGRDDYPGAVATYLSLCIGRMADRHSKQTRWDPNPTGYAPKIGNTFNRQALPMIWDYVEGNPFGDSSGNLGDSIEWVVKVLERVPATPAGLAEQRDAVQSSLVDRFILCTDPPYYDNVPYADLSDYFYVWLRRSLAAIYPSLFSTVLVPKKQELVADPFRHRGRAAACEFFERGMSKFFVRARASVYADIPATVFYAFKQSESGPEDDVDGPADNEGSGSDWRKDQVLHASTGWETMLRGLIEAGMAVTGTWPMRTELSNRIRSLGSNALASSIVLVCRPRSETARLATRKEFMNALRQELPEALRNLQHGNIAPVDLAQSAIGPGMGVFTRYAKVIESDGSPMTVRTALGIINQVLDEVLAEQEGEFDADTRWALAWFEQFGMQEAAFGEAETLSKAKNTAVNGLVEAGVVKARGGKVKLVSRAELPDDWDPATDKRLTVWETTQHLIRTLETQGEAAAASLLNKLGGVGDTARDLAYRLYSLCERKKWADEALAYNSLVIAWPELSKLALAERNRGVSSTQQEMF